MRFLTIACVLVAPVLMACGAEVSIKVDDGRSERTEVTLTRGDTLSVGVAADGAVDITAVVAAGKAHAGTYRSTNPALQETATEAKNALGEAGATVTLEVQPDGRIVSIGLARGGN